MQIKKCINSGYNYIASMMSRSSITQRGQAYQSKWCYGFTAIELSFALIILVGLFLFTNMYLQSLYKVKKNNQVADQVNIYQEAAIRYINDNYRQLDQALTQNDSSGTQVIILPIRDLASYLPKGISIIMVNSQSPCLYIRREVNINSQMKDLVTPPFNAYLVFGYLANAREMAKHKVDTLDNSMNIARSIGGNAGILIPSIDGFIINGMNTAGATVFKYNSTIGIKCGFTTSNFNMSGANKSNGYLGIDNGLPNYSIVVDLVKNNHLFNQIQIKSDVKNKFQKNDTLDPEPTLIRNGVNANMQTNLYLDNVIKESSSINKYFCDATKLSVADAISICNNYAKYKGYEMYAGTALWGSSIISGDQKTCTNTANAHFNYISTLYSCSGVAFPDPTSICPHTKGNKIIEANSGYWNPSSSILSGQQCVSSAYAKYQSISCLSMFCWRWERGGIHCMYSNRQKASNLEANNMFKICPNVSEYTGNSGSGVYDSISNKCIYQIKCKWDAKGILTANSDPKLLVIAVDSDPTLCNQSYAVPASFVSSIIDAGFQNCMPSYSTPALYSTIGIPAQHRYHALNFVEQTLGGKYVHVKSGAPDGATVTTSVLTVNNAGVQSGYIVAGSHAIVAGSSCLSSDLGKMTQQQYGVRTPVTSQLQCTYSPIFCSGSSYCYTPIKLSGISYNYNLPKVSGSCPTGSVVGELKHNWIDTSVICPVKADLTLIGGITGETDNTSCYIVAGFTICSRYQTVCNYKDINGQIQKYLVPALVKLDCTSTVNTFIVDNYTP